MLKQLTTDALEGAILQSLSDSPQSPKEIKTKVVVILASDNYETNLTTSTGLDNLYIKVKDKLRSWGKKGINCKDIGNAQWVLANSEVVESSPKPVKAIKTPKPVKQAIVVNEEPTIVNEEPTIVETQPIVNDEPIVETQPIIVEPKTQPITIEQPKKQNNTKKEETLMETINKNIDMWIERAKADGQEIESTIHDLECPSIRALAISTTKCFSDYKATDDECKICPLAKWCSESLKNNSKVSNVQAYIANPRLEAEAKAEADAKAKAKADAKAQQPVVSQKLNDAVSKFGKQEIELQSDIKCTITGDLLKAGTKGYFVNTIGVVSPRCFA